MKKRSAEEQRKRRKAREAIRAAWLAGATDARILADAEELDVSSKIAREELAQVEREHQHPDLTPHRLRAVLWQGVAIASELGDVRALLAAVKAIDKLDATSTRHQAERAKITDVQSLAAAVQRGDLDPYQAQAMRPLIELAQGTGGAVEKEAERYSTMTIEELGALYAEKIGARR